MTFYPIYILTCYNIVPPWKKDFVVVVDVVFILFLSYEQNFLFYKFYFGWVKNKRKNTKKRKR